MNIHERRTLAFLRRLKARIDWLDSERLDQQIAMLEALLHS